MIQLSQLLAADPELHAIVTNRFHRSHNATDVTLEEALELWLNFYGSFGLAKPLIKCYNVISQASNPMVCMYLVQTIDCETYTDISQSLTIDPPYYCISIETALDAWLKTRCEYQCAKELLDLIKLLKRLDGQIPGHAPEVE